MEVIGQLHALAELSLGKEPLVPNGYEAGWAPESIWMPCPCWKLNPSGQSKFIFFMPQPCVTQYNRTF